MADASHPFDARRRRPRDWSDALANLPLETPPLSVWAQIEARLSTSSESTAAASVNDSAHVTSSSKPAVATHPAASRRRLSTRHWLALAASLSAIALLPLIWPDTRKASSTPTFAAATSSSRATAAIAPGSRDEPAIAPPRATSRDRIASLEPMAAAQAMSSPTHPMPPSDAPLSSEIARVPADAMPQQIVSATPIAPTPVTPPPTASIESTTAHPAELASVDTEQLPANAVLVGEADADATHREMEMLYAASAQLETLLAYARDPRVETGPAAALSSEIHTRLATIDARLAQPGLSEHEQYALWQARVGTLRQAVAFESEQRALSAEGQGFEGQLVEIY